jgi:L-serine kinase (ATP) / ParB family transcriptional regulator, heme-responsive regulator
MYEILNKLKLVHADNVILHEHYEPIRLEQTMIDIEREGHVKNAVSVIPLKEGKYMVIDGTHRTLALKKLECTTIPVQLVSPQEFKLDVWKHIVSSDDWLSTLSKNKIVDINSVEAYDFFSVNITINNKEEFKVLLNKKSEGFNEFLNSSHMLVSAYSNNHYVKRVRKEEKVCTNRGDVSISFPSISLNQIQVAVEKGKLFPPGITRFIINNRLLNLKIPLHLLKNIEPDQNIWGDLMQKWENKLRYYQESVYFCE